MNPGAAYADAFAGAVQSMTPLQLATQMRDIFGGSNRALARELNVSLRTVERWFTTAQQRRTPGKASAERLHELAQTRTGQLAARQVRRRGVRAHVQGEVTDPSGNPRLRDIHANIAPDGDATEALAVALENGDADDIAGAFDAAFFEAYGGLDGFGFSDVDGAELGWG